MSRITCCMFPGAQGKTTLYYVCFLAQNCILEGQKIYLVYLCVQPFIATYCFHRKYISYAVFYNGCCSAMLCAYPDFICTAVAYLSSGNLFPLYILTQFLYHGCMIACFCHLHSNNKIEVIFKDNIYLYSTCNYLDNA